VNRPGFLDLDLLARLAVENFTDNADKLIKNYTRLSNSARQAEITQQISEIVGGADALSSSGDED